MFYTQNVKSTHIFFKETLPYKNNKNLLIKKFFKKKRKKTTNLSNFFLYNLYNINCWYIQENFFLLPVLQTERPFSGLFKHTPLAKNELIIKHYYSKYKTSRDFLFVYLTLSNTYRNFFCNLSYKIKGIKKLAEKRKYFLQDNFMQTSFTRDRFNIVLDLKKNNINTITTLKKKTFLNLWFSNQSYLVFLFLFVCLLKTNTLKLKKISSEPRQHSSTHTSGGLVAKTQIRGLVFLKKNSPSFLYKYFQNIFNSLTKLVTGDATLNNFSHIHLTILLKNFDKRYNFILKRLLKKFRKQVYGSTFHRKNLKIYKNSALINTILKKKTTTIKVPLNMQMPLFPKTMTTSLLYKTICLRLYTFQNIRKKFLMKKFHAINMRNAYKIAQKNKQVVLNYQFFDLTGLPHNGTKTKTKPRK